MDRTKLANLKADLWLQSVMREQQDPKFQEERKKIARGLSDIPISQIYEQIQHIREVMMPQLEKISGKENERYRRLEQILKALTYAIMLADRFQVAEMQNTRLRMVGEIYREQAELFQSELLKYTTLEDLLLSDSLNRYSEAIAKKVNQSLNKISDNDRSTEKRI